MKNIVFLFLALFLIPHFYCNSSPESFIKRDGNKLAINGKEIQLRGICFGNDVWEVAWEKFQEIPVFHHNETDYKKIHDWGMNAVRFYINYKTFEDDKNPFKYKQSGWDWLDKNIAWAKKHGIYLILNIHVPQGGYQSLNQGANLWNSNDDRERFINLWKEIASHCKNEPAVAGYDLLNEPVVTNSIDQWKNLAEQTIDEIRKEDKNHLIIIECALGISNKYETYHRIDNLFLVNDNNVLYSFHFYEPHEFTHQKAPWTAFGDGGNYPDNKLYVMPDDLQKSDFRKDNTCITKGNSNWTLYEGKLFQSTDSNNIGIRPFLVTLNNGKGNVLFKNLTIKEYDENKKFVRDICSLYLDSKTGWTYAAKNDEGKMEIFKEPDNNMSLSLKGAGKYGLAVSGKIFPVNYRYYYQISGYMKGFNIENDSRAMFSIGFEKSKSGKKLVIRNKNYLESEINKYVEFSKKNNVPLYCGEFGCIRFCYEENKGGLNWTNDLMDIFMKNKISFTYHAYHEGWFGVFRNDDGLPDEKYANDKLIELFKKKLND